MAKFEYSVELNDRDWAEFYLVTEECNLLQASLATADEQNLSDTEQTETPLCQQAEWRARRVRVSLCSGVDTQPTCSDIPASSPMEPTVLSDSEEEMDLGSVSRFLCDRGTSLLYQHSVPSSSASASSHRALCLVSQQSRAGSSLNMHSEDNSTIGALTTDRLHVAERCLPNELSFMQVGPQRAQRQGQTLDSSPSGTMDQPMQVGCCSATSSSSFLTQGAENIIFPYPTEQTLDPNNDDTYLLEKLVTENAELPEVTDSWGLSNCLRESDSDFHVRSARAEASWLGSNTEQDRRLRLVTKSRESIHPAETLSETTQKKGSDKAAFQRQEHEPGGKQLPTSSDRKLVPHLEKHKHSPVHVTTQSLRVKDDSMELVFMGALWDDAPYTNDVQTRSFPPPDCSPLKGMHMNGRSPMSVTDGVSQAAGIFKDEGVITAQEVAGENYEHTPQEDCESRDGQQVPGPCGSPSQTSNHAVTIPEMGPVLFCENHKKVVQEGISGLKSGRAPVTYAETTYEYFFPEEDESEANERALILSLPVVAFKRLTANLKSLMSSQAHLLRSRIQGSRNRSQEQELPLFQFNPCARGKQLETKCKDLQAVTGKGPRLLSSGHGDMCLVFLAFASWAANSSAMQSPNAWKTALITNTGAVSAICYFRRHVGRERWHS
uniref:PGC-1 and ERR-induced regulator in muscle protein 1 n=1 Tax=Geotrypetes seraphini TaxID=260995 RepID=A0A6P8P582_GEOSA|nr:PGC-1 and ERR-induced regulator in muscle protein 1 [Geotrypetes seraphini]XP_033778801.1 PGC-1 and ERR-induced regulator in muscle protein 1 [Geotrypetes seraphini]XP_033778802.1 PGC-1 and ERR-induced regulator in muscle protein 1 [Geotrypetes seraphini]XP_033778803.1 PGC-1 and ERR-induced regulator in muscle protein 1 [Geotrypetes seraphini]XP_033778804.1 PGC-1 and ERR-induced regulator in muscle protein 1 [Geotrypetes seraphini]